MITITKADVLKAVAEEPLCAGNWIFTKRSKGKCMVCAVGGVLRTVSVPDDQIDELACHLTLPGEFIESMDWEFELGAGRPLNALSIVFETLWADSPVSRKYLAKRHPSTVRRVRRDLAAWVEEHMPNSFTVEETL